jgi:hypothetical protein
MSNAIETAAKAHEQKKQRQRQHLGGGKQTAATQGLRVHGVGATANGVPAAPAAAVAQQQSAAGKVAGKKKRKAAEAGMGGVLATPSATAATVTNEEPQPAAVHHPVAPQADAPKRNSKKAKVDAANPASAAAAPAEAGPPLQHKQQVKRGAAAAAAPASLAAALKRVLAKPQRQQPKAKQSTLYTPSQDNADGEGTPLPSPKKNVRFHLKNNLVMTIGEPPAPADVRTPPSSKPKGPALKKESTLGGSRMGTRANTAKAAAAAAGVNGSVSGGKKNKRRGREGLLFGSGSSNQLVAPSSLPRAKASDFF